MNKIAYQIFFAVTILALNNGLGLTPPLGFNTWNHFACNITEKVIYDTIDAIINLGLRDLGYIYINIDDCWMAKKRNEMNELVPDPTKFPNGIKAIADYCHDQGLKLGIYSSAGTRTCQGYPASLDYEDIDALTWATWGIDYLKYDNCNHDKRSAYVRYTRMREALNSTGRPIYYSICNYGQENVWSWGKEVGNSWRTTEHIQPTFESIRKIYMQNVQLAKYAGPGGWNDPDMLEIGNGKMTYEESKTHFSLWAMAKSPLLIGCNLSNISKETLEILKNKDIIELNQDKLGVQSTCALNCERSDFLGTATKPQITLLELDDDGYAMAVTNWNDKVPIKNVTIKFKDLLLPKLEYGLIDYWTKREYQKCKEFVIEILKVHETKVYELY